MILDYKRIIRNKNTRMKILKLLDFVPDKIMIKIQYRISTGKRLNLANPQRFTEKLQWYKLYYRNPLMTQCADKYAVRDYIKGKGYEKILVPLYGVYESSDEIDFNKLPNKFVIKTTNGSHTNIICEDKQKLDVKEAKETIDKWLNTWEGKVGREWAYYNINSKIICEKYLEKDINGDLADYKFFCFNGKVKYMLLCKNRFSENGMKLGFFNDKFNFIDIGVERYSLKDKNNNRINVEKPVNFYEMKEIAEKLSEDFPHVRVDLYNLNGKIYFGELTFYDASGYIDYGEFDIMLGNMFNLPERVL